MENKLTVICVLNQSENTPFTIEWVQKLKNMVSRNLDYPHYFVCFSNVTMDLEGVSCIPLRYGFPGWWAKLEIFRDAPGSRVLYLDLDVLIYRNIQPIIDFPADFAIGPPYGRPNIHKKKKLKNVRPGYNSSVMIFDRGNITEEIWSKFNKNPKRWMRLYRGDQDFLQEFFPDLDTLPAKWIPKLGGCITDTGDFAPSKHAKIILCMPWKNYVASERYPFVRELWQ